MCKIAKKMVAMVIARKTILCFTKVVLNVEQIACKYSRRHQGNRILLLERFTNIEIKSYVIITITI